MIMSCNTHKHKFMHKKWIIPKKRRKIPKKAKFFTQFLPNARKKGGNPKISTQNSIFLLICEKDEKICKSYQKERFCVKRLVRKYAILNRFGAKNNKKRPKMSVFCLGARDRTWTDTSVRTQDFKSCASAYSATRARKLWSFCINMHNFRGERGIGKF